MTVAELRRFLESLPQSYDTLPVVVAPSAWRLPAETSRCVYIPAEEGGLVSVGPVVLLEPT